MSTNIDRLLERVRQNSIARLAALADARQAATPGVTRRDREHAPGDRVFDPVTGQEGEVIGGGVENIIIPGGKQ